MVTQLIRAMSIPGSLRVLWRHSKPGYALSSLAENLLASPSSDSATLCLQYKVSAFRSYNYTARSGEKMPRCEAEELFSEVPESYRAIVAGTDARYLWFALRDWRCNDSEGYFGVLGAWAEVRMEEMGDEGL
ncbi:3-hydroxybutyryl-CoA dehydratase [Venturia nashicola]|uniref:3-hydroxybutyryl-CoA dehydratase n=1 Tax=Venturia nashicola TaxID=86259 RepID=A0A4Z1PIN1_9PEZI|nr:3-hydroxybutyryl-CoA dehydratase [Venturia nashicola]